MKMKPIVLRLVAAFAAFGVAAPPLTAIAQVNQWLGVNSGNWLDPDNWDLGVVPADGQHVRLTDNGSSIVSVVDYGLGVSPPPQFNSLVIDGLVLNHATGDPLATNDLVVGETGQASYNLTGAAQVTVAINLVVGAQGGANGYFGQVDTGSEVFVGGDLVLGEQTGAVGEYELSGGTLTTMLQTVVGAAGNGTFTNSGGEHFATMLVLGRDAGDPGSVGTYRLSSASTTSLGSTIVGDAGTGVFENGSGGYHAIGSDPLTDRLVLGLSASGIGTYKLDGGTVVVEGITVVGDAGTGVFEHLSGTHGTAGLVLGNLATGSGTYTLDGTSAVVNVVGDLVVGAAGTGTFNHLAGEVTTQNLRIATGFPGSTGGYTIESGTLQINGDLTIGVDPSTNFQGGTGTFVHNGGSVVVEGAFLMDGGYGAGQGRYTLNGGTLDSGFFGSMSDDTLFVHDGGEHSNRSLFIIGNSGGSDFDSVYKMTSAGAVANFNDLWVGGFGRGVLQQDAGTVNVDGELRIGDGPNLDPARRYGIYNLYGGMLSASNDVVVGSGNGGFLDEPGGLGSLRVLDATATVGGDLILGQSGPIGGGTGTLVLLSGTVSVTGDARLGEGSALFGGQGVVEQSGGTLDVHGGLFLGSGNGRGTYILTGGEVNAGITYVGEGGFARLNVSGGQFNTGFLNVGIFDGANSIVTITGGVVDVADNLNVGGGQSIVNALVDHRAGEVKVNSPNFGLYVNANGEYRLSGSGDVQVAANVFVGGGGGGIFSQSGSSNLTVGGGLFLGELGDGVGTFTMTGGTTTVSQQVLVGQDGQGHLVVNGGTFDAATSLGLFSIQVAETAGSSGSVTVGGSGILKASNVLTIGVGGSGTMTQGDSSTVSVGGLRLGNLAGGDGSYTLNGGTLDVLSTAGVSGGTRVGMAGTGTFTHNGGTHNTTFLEIGGASFGQGGGGTGAYTMNGGALNVSGTITVNVGGGSTGALNVAGGTVTASAISNFDTFTFTGGSVKADVTNYADFSVGGAAPRTLTGSLTNKAGTTAIAVDTPLTITGTLAQAGGAIDAGANVIVGSDYTNAGFGSGNTFDRRAGVSGAGQIVGLNASQTVTATANPGALSGTGANTFTLDFGTVRGGGSRTLSFEVANNGSGADIRGAIQTAANGGNVTDARLSGSGVTAGNFGPIAAGADSGGLSVTFNAASGSGALAGQTVAVYGNFENVATQVLTISGAATTLATGNASPSGNPVNLGNFRVGGSAPAQSFSVENQATGPLAERLGIGSVGSSGNFAATNNLGGGFVGPGGTQSNAVTAAVSGGVAGINSGSVTIQYTTNGQLIDPTFTTQNANSQTVNLQATGFVAAAGAVQTPALNFGNVQVGQTVTQNLVIRNTASGPAGFVEDLNASFGSSTDARITGTGTLSGILAGTNSTGANGLMTVNVNTAAAGSVNGSIDVLYQTAGAVAGVSNGLGTAAAGSEAYGVIGTILQGNVIDQARPVINGVANPGTVTVDFGNLRVGGPASQTLTVLNEATGNQQALLNAGIASNGAPVSVTGGFTGLAPGQSSPSSGTGAPLQVTLDTSAAGLRSGSATVSLVSDITSFGNCAPNCTLNLPSQMVDVKATVFNLAAGSAAPAGPIELGNVRVGGVLAQTFSVSNTAAAGAFSEDLNASFGASTGQAQNNGGSVTGLLAGASNGTAMVASLGTATAGAKTGTVTIDYTSAGAVAGVANGLGTLGVGSQTVTLNGAVYNTAVGQATPSPVNLGNFRVGQAGGAAPQSQAVGVANTVAGPFTESLGIASATVDNTAFSVTNNLGSGLVAAGASNAGALTVARTGGTAGVNTGTVSIQYTSDGTGTSGLAAINANSETVAVSATGFLQAQPNVPASVNLGNRRVGGSASQAITIANTNVAGGFQEGLDAAVGALGGQATASGGPISNLAAGASSSAISVGLQNIVAGNGNAGTVSIQLASNGTNSGLAELILASQTVSVSATGYRLAQPTIDTPVVTVAARVGDAVSADRVVSITNTSPDMFQEGLKVTVAGAGGNAQHNGGAIANLGQGLTDATSIRVGLGSTAVAGQTSGTVTLNLFSTGAGTTGEADASLGTADVSVQGRVYAQAVAQLNTPVLNFGIRRVGDVVAARDIGVTNAAAAAALNDTLKATAGAAPAGFSVGTGSVSGLSAGAGGALSASVDTSAAGIYSSLLNVAFAGQNPDMADQDLGSQSVQLLAQVNNLANPVFGKSGGAGSFGCVGLTCTLDFGTVVAGSTLSANLFLQNLVDGPADALDGAFTLALGGFLGSGFDPVDDLLPGGVLGGLGIGFTASTLGLWEGFASFDGFSVNASDPAGVALQQRRLRVLANVVDDPGGTVPLPGTLSLVLLAAGLAAGVRRLRPHAPSRPSETLA